MVAQLQPGVVEIDLENGEDGEKYFVPGGFAVIHEDR
jgi:F0F1-type ATP synthase epsilon subunit